MSTVGEETCVAERRGYLGDKTVEVPGELISVPFSKIPAEELAWLWPGRVLQGKLNLIVGHPGVGKSFITLDIASRVSTGGEWPDAGKAPLGDALILAEEDNPHDTIRPRLEASGANLKRVHYAKGMLVKEGDPHLRRMRLDTDWRALEKKIRADRIALVIVDPLVDFLRAQVKVNEELAVREALLQPLADVAQRTGATILGVMHLNKKQNLENIQRVGGAMAFVGLSRSVLLAESGENGAKLSQLKMNLTEKPAPLRYTVEGSPIGRVVWGGQDEDGKQASKQDEARILLEEMLPVYAPGVPGIPVAEVNAKALQRRISVRTLERVRGELGVVSQNVGGTFYLWRRSPASMV